MHSALLKKLEDDFIRDEGIFALKIFTDMWSKGIRLDILLYE
jgi:hypothetical protein